MLNIKKIQLLLLLLAAFYTTNAQINFKEASIVQLNGDTLKGEINYQEWVYNPKTIEFRQKSTDNRTTYSSKDIKGFIINYKNEKYQSAVVDISNESIETSNLKEYDQVKDVEQTPQTVKGASFYVHKEKSGQRRLLIFTGVALPSVTLNDDYYVTTLKTMRGETSPLFGIGFEQSYNRLRNKLAVGIDINAANCKTDFTIDYLVLYSRTIHYKVNTISVFRDYQHFER